MVDDAGVKYEHQSVKVIRGREATKVAEMQNQGWELVSQTQGKLRTEMTFHRVKKTDYRPLIGIGVLLGVGILLMGAGALFGDDEPDPNAPPPAAASTASDEPTDDESEAPSGQPSESATPTEQSSLESPTDKPTDTPTDEPTEEPTGAPPGDAVLTMQNSTDLKAMLRADDDWELNAAFAEAYKGRRIQFDGSISDATPGYYLVYFGDNSDTEVTSGPAFQFKVRSLQVAGRPVANGDNL